MMPLGVDVCRALKVAGIGKTVIEIGSKPAPGQETLANLRPIFGARKYVGVDIEAGPGVDIVCDGTRLKTIFQRREFELGLCIDTLEHCWEPGIIVKQLIAVSEHVALRVPFSCPVHDHPYDYWRFTTETVARWLKESRLSHGFVAKDPPLFSYPGEWPNGVYGFGTSESTVRVDVVKALQARPARDIMITEIW